VFLTMGVFAHLTDHEYDVVLDTFKWVLVAIYIGIAIGSLVQSIRIYRNKKRTKSSKPKALFVLLLVQAVVRAIILCIPVEIFKNHIRHIPQLQIFLDLFASLLSFSTYMMLLLIWAEMYYFSKKIKDTGSIKWRLWVFYGLVNVAVYVVGLLMCVLLGGRGEYSHFDLMAEAIFLAVLSGFLAILFPIYGFMLFAVLRKAVISSERKTKMVFKLQILLAVCILCFLLQSAYVVLMDWYEEKLVHWSAVAFAIVWSGYFLITDQIPAVLILYVTQKFAIRKRDKSSRPLLPYTQYTVHQDPDQSGPVMLTFGGSFRKI